MCGWVCVSIFFVFLYKFVFEKFFFYNPKMLINHFNWSIKMVFKFWYSVYELICLDYLENFKNYKYYKFFYNDTKKYCMTNFGGIV